VTAAKAKRTGLVTLTAAKTKQQLQQKQG